MARSKLARYREMRDFAATAEPPGNDKVVPSERFRFVIQKHAASHLHFDLRLEHDGRFLSWAVPKGPSLDPKERRLAIEVEDHPLEYGDFEGTIPEDQYGGGTIMLWDRGYWAPEKGFEKIGQALDKGELKFVMEGERMHGSWVLVRTRSKARGRASWILIKHRDNETARGKFRAPSERDRSVASGRTMADIAAGKGQAASPFMTSAGASANAVWQSDREQAAPARRSKPAKAKRTAKATLPEFVAPQLAKKLARPPTGAGWAHEIKLDGYRMQLRVSEGKAILRTRKGLDWSERFPGIIASGARLGSGIYDGEVVALDETDAPDFAALQAALGDGHTNDLIYFVFDQLFDGMEDLRKLPLVERKARLKESLADAAKTIRYVEHFVDPGEAVLRSACRMNLEGIVSKKLDARYQPGRAGTWVKCKCRAGHEVVIGAYTTTRGQFRSLIAGVNRNGKLVEVGRIGTGFGRSKVARILPRLQALETDKSPFSRKISGRAAGEVPGEVHWVRPELVAEIEYEGFTADGLLRQAAFKGMREDKPAREVKTVEPAPATTGLREPAPSTVRVGTARAGGSAVVMNVTLSHAEKPLWPDGGDGRPVTKRDLARYFEAVGGWMIRHLRGRPCSIIRFPDGIEGERFFQRHAGKGQSNLISSVRARGDRQSYLQFDRVEAVIAAAQMATLELHPWNSQPFAPEQPGRFVFDLDPAPDVAFENVIGAAREIRDWLDDLGLVSFCKTTGGKGLHVVTPLEAKGVDWPAAKEFARNVCKVMAADAPDRYLISMAKARREGRIFLDYLRNDRMASAVAPLSPRGRPGAPVSMPLNWAQVKKGLDPAQYTIRTVPARIGKMTAWQDYCEAERPLKAAIKRLGRV